MILFPIIYLGAGDNFIHPTNEQTDNVTLESFPFFYGISWRVCLGSQRLNYAETLLNVYALQSNHSSGKGCFKSLL